ncbi:MAG TPA: DPP IV N-terminal domain-containing protein, partial [Arenimonas sp.]|nr:DPP IV N-terminal domain-containing protein [Arenimonas sp.]
MPLLRTFTLGAALFSAHSMAQTPITLDQAMAHPDWIGTPIESSWWSANSQSIYFRQKLIGSPVRALYQNNLQNGQTIRVENQAWSQVDEANQRFDKAHRRAVFIREGDVFIRELETNQLIQVTKSAESESSAQFSADDASVYYRRGNDWFAWRGNGLTETYLQLKTAVDPNVTPKPSAANEHELRLIATLARQKSEREQIKKDNEATRSAAGALVKTAYLDKALTISGSSLSPNGQYALVITQEKDADEGKTDKMPLYVHESGYVESEEVRTRVGRNDPVPQSLWLVNVATQTVKKLDFSSLPGISTDPLANLRKAQKLDALKGNRPVRMDFPIVWSADGSQVTVMVRSIDNKDRWLAGVNFSEASLTTRHRLTDNAWINWSFNEFGFLPNNQFWYLSEQTGYSHLYVGEGKNAKALSTGNFEASSVQWNTAGTQAFFLCNRKWPGDYEVCRVNADGSNFKEVTALDGVEDFSLAPNDQQLAVRYSGSYLPPQLAVVNAQSGETKILTDSRSAEFKARNFMQPEYVQVPSKHGAGVIWAKLYKPAQFEAGKKYPIALFVHGAGYLQNVSNRYPNYYREQMFHNLLVQQGYVVLDMDYRASEGYG